MIVVEESVVLANHVMVFRFSSLFVLLFSQLCFVEMIEMIVSLHYRNPTSMVVVEENVFVKKDVMDVQHERKKNEYEEVCPK
jgi:hypothetical protein